jgi:phage terminase large subunit-like protein
VNVDLAAVRALSPEAKREVLALLEEKERRKRQNKLARYKPYPKQAEFHALGATIRERLLMAGNQLGKTLAGGDEVAMHLTGRYPSWWQGRVFNRPVVWWVASETMEVSRDGAQRILLGRGDSRGEGAIPGDAIKSLSRYPNVVDAIAQATIAHESGGTSLVIFKSYDQGRRKFQGDTIDGIWFDEEPPAVIYTEGMTRTNATFGPVMMTFTPLLGMSDVVMRFLQPDEGDEGAKDRAVVSMTIDDVTHYTAEERASIVASYPEHEREARTKGVPIMGSGRVFPIAEERIAFDPAEVPLQAHWPRIAGIDFGWDHPTGAAWLAWDRDADVVYVYADYSQSEQTPVIHGAAIKAKGADIPVAWPHDGLQHDKGSGEQLAQQYRAQGVAMLPTRATFADGTNGVEAGVMDMLDRMQTGRLKVSRACTNWWREFRLYHRKDGLIVKLNDDVISASRYALMMLRHAKVAGNDVPVRLNQRSEFARGR